MGKIIKLNSGSAKQENEGSSQDFSMKKEALLKGEQTSKEIINLFPKLEKENLRVNEKINWKEITDPNGVRVLVNPEEDIREYLEGENKGEQLFTKHAALREAEKQGKRLPRSSKVYEDIVAYKYNGNYQDFLKGENMKFCGWRHPFFETFESVGDEFAMMCEGDKYFHGDKEKGGSYPLDETCGKSVRCLED